MKLRSIVFCLFACGATLGAANATAQTSPNILPAPSSGNAGAAPNGIAALQLTPTDGELLFTQPFCAGNQSRGIYSENIALGQSTLVSQISPNAGCAENYVTISPGLGGFTAGDTFVTGISTTNPANSEVFKNGTTPFVDPVPNSQNHVGVTFDTVGTFGFNLIVTAQGSVSGYDSTGTVKFTYMTSPDFALESATVAPSTYAFCPGCLFMTAAATSNINNANPSGDGAIFFVAPGTASGTTVSLWSLTPGSVEPEGIMFVGNGLSCTLRQGNNQTPYRYFVSGYATGSQRENGQATNGNILAFTPAQLAAYAGDMLIPDEQGTIFAFSGRGVAPTTFSTTGYQLEASTILPCPTGGCPATLGFWKHHAFPPSMFVGGEASIGCVNYSSATLLNILNTSPQGNAVIILAHQLITAIANYDAGATQTPAANEAIASAISLLCANNINLSTSSVAASTTLGQEMTALANTLDTYNSSAPNCEGSGLS